VTAAARITKRSGDRTGVYDREAATRTAGVAAALMLAGLARFPVGLAVGAPWGANAYGGRVVTRHGVRPASYRSMSLAASLLLSLAAWVLLVRAGVARPGRVRPTGVDRGTWAVVAVLAVGTVGNLASASAVERWGLGSLTALATALALRVARSAPRGARCEPSLADDGGRGHGRQ
jgi:hypothetical protein